MVEMKSQSRVIFFFNDTATTEIYTLSLHDALPIFDDGNTCDPVPDVDGGQVVRVPGGEDVVFDHGPQDRKSTRLNSSHANISYAVFCLKKKQNLCYFISLLLRPS